MSGRLIEERAACRSSSKSGTGESVATPIAANTGPNRSRRFSARGSRMTVKIDGKDCLVTVDQAARTAVSFAAVGTLWVTEA